MSTPISTESCESFAHDDTFDHTQDDEDSFHVEVSSSPVCPLSPPTPDQAWRRRAGPQPELKRISREASSRPSSDYGPARALPFSTGEGTQLVHRAPLVQQRSRKRFSRFETGFACESSTPDFGQENDDQSFDAVPSQSLDHFPTRSRTFTAAPVVPPLVLPRSSTIESDFTSSDPSSSYLEGSATAPSMRRHCSQISEYELERSSGGRLGLSRSMIFDRRQVKMQRSTKNCSLPTIRGSHPDCNIIACDTLAKLLANPRSLPAPLTSFRVIDCRYKYEYDGGAIRGAENIANEYDVEKHFFPASPAAGTTAIIFHCEFSSKRGPSQYRKLRSTDRKEKGMCYPELFYPEIYLLEGGYHDFFKLYPQFCSPENYVPMKAEEHRAELHSARALGRSHTYQGLTTQERARSLRTLSQSLVDIPLIRSADD